MPYRSESPAWPAPSTGAGILGRPYRAPEYPRVRVRCTKAFYLAGELIEVGAEVVVIEPLASDLVAWGRAELL